MKRPDEETYRLTIILGVGQRERLLKAAEQNRTSVSTIARNLIDIGLATVEG